MPEDVKTQVTALNEALTDGSGHAGGGAGSVYRYLAIPAAERSYVFAAGAADRMQELSLEITPEDPAQAYELRVAAGGDHLRFWRRGMDRQRRRGVVAAGIVIWSKRRKYVRSNGEKFCGKCGRSSSARTMVEKV